MCCVTDSYVAASIIILRCLGGRLCQTLWGFFFQAEDGIRDLVRSRGLGDVYKRQSEKKSTATPVEEPGYRRLVVLAGEAQQVQQAGEPVSYTHLTLPTSDLV